jgi:glycosyltransferase involved in cell wall biosynthesis
MSETLTLPPLSIAYVTMQFPKGSEAFAAVDVRALRKLGADVHVFAMRQRAARHDDMLRQFDLTDVSVSVPSWRTLLGALAMPLRPGLAMTLARFILRHTWNRPRHFLACIIFAPRAWEIALQLERLRPDVVHLFWGHWPAMVGAMFKRILPDSALTIFLGAYDLSTRFSGSSEIGRTSHTVFTHAHCNIQPLERLGIPRKHVSVIHRGIDVTSAEGAKNDRVTGRILTVGRLIAGKGMDDALQTFAEVKKAHPHIHLVVLGDGPERHRLEGLAREFGVGDSVRFNGHVAHSSVLAEMRQAEILLMLSKSQSERLPNVIKEALACGCASVATATLGIEELLPAGCGGLVVPIGDKKQAVDALSTLVSDAGIRSDLVERGQAWVRQYFDAENSMRRYYETWSKYIRGKL